MTHQQFAAQEQAGDISRSEIQLALKPILTLLPADAAEEQVLRIATGSTGSNSFNFYPMNGGGDQQSWMPLLYVPPLYFDVDGNLQFGVFDSAVSSEGDTVWTFTIDERAVWSDGTPITAQQVVGTWNRMTDPLTEHGRIPQYIGNVVGFAEARADEAETVSGLESWMTGPSRRP